MATQWILGKVTDALQPTMQSVVSSAGSMAGGTINAVGSTINGVGDSINSNIKYYGDGAKDYGNAVMDWTKASGSRGQTASNPLGLSADAAGGKRAVTSPDIYRPAPKPKTGTSKSSVAGKAVPGKTLTSPPVKKVGGVVPAKKMPPTSAASVKKPVVGTKTARPPVAATKSISAASKPKVAPSTKVVPSAPDQKVGSNPLGLTSGLKK